MSQHAIDAYLDELLMPVEAAHTLPPGLAVVHVAPVHAEHASPARSDVAIDEPASAMVAAPLAEASPVLPPQVADAAADARAPSPDVAAPAAPGPRFRRAGDTAPLAGMVTPAVTRTSRWLRMNIHHDSYAFELLRVQEVVRTVPILAMRGAAPSVLGVMNLRGRIVPVFDLGRWLGSGFVTPDERARIVVIERDDELIGVLVSVVEDVVTLAREHIEPPLANGDPGAIVGIARAGHAPTVLLDANALFD